MDQAQAKASHPDSPRTLVSARCRRSLAAARCPVRYLEYASQFWAMAFGAQARLRLAQRKSKLCVVHLSGKHELLFPKGTSQACRIHPVVHMSSTASVC